MLNVRSVSKVYAPPPRWLRPLVRSAVRSPVRAVNQVSFGVAAGEIVGLVGPNGAGKTTLLKMIATLLEPTSGQISVDGYDVLKDPLEVCRRLGLVLEGDQGLYDRLTGVQNLEFYGMMAGMPRRAARSRARDLLARLGLHQHDKLVFGYSAGMRMRLSVCRALMADPPLIVLDEPTRSLDPLVSRFMQEMLRDLAAQGHAIVLSNHRLDEVVTTCDRIVAIIHGEVRFDGTADSLTGARNGASAALLDIMEREANVR
jgi:ABC-2 type transport system ATP-binding protein